MFGNYIWDRDSGGKKLHPMYVPNLDEASIYRLFNSVSSREAAEGARQNGQF